VARDSIIFCVNASQHKLDQLGIPAPHFAVMRSNIGIGTRPENGETQPVLRGRSTGTLIVVGLPSQHQTHLAFLSGLDYRFDNHFLMSKYERSKLINQMTRSRLGAYLLPRMYLPSMGISAVFLALHMGADRVVMSGFSFRSGGHSYSTSDLRRLHVDEDRIALRAARKVGTIVATDAAFAEDSGLSFLPS
jgi:hypothetical protein